MAFFLLRSFIFEGLKIQIRAGPYGVTRVLFLSREIDLNGSDESKELTMNTIFLFVIGIAALSGPLVVMIYLLAVSREMELPDGDEV